MNTPTIHRSSLLAAFSVVSLIGCGPSGPADFVGIKWSLETYRVGTAAPQSFQADPRWVVFGSDGLYHQTDGCNRSTGRWSEANGVLTAMPGSSTLKLCGATPSDGFLYPLFSQTASLRRTGSALVLTGAEAEATFSSGHAAALTGHGLVETDWTLPASDDPTQEMLRSLGFVLHFGAAASREFTATWGNDQNSLSGVFGVSASNQIQFTILGYKYDPAKDSHFVADLLSSSTFEVSEHSLVLHSAAATRQLSR